jgi:hypothetical protein
MNGCYDVTQTIQPSKYVTEYDSMHQAPGGLADRQYAKGLEMGRRGDVITISRRGVWSAAHGDGAGHTFSYETLGLHACTLNLIEGWLVGGATIRKAGA